MHDRPASAEQSDRPQPGAGTGARHRGRGARRLAAGWAWATKNEADGAAVEAMRQAFDAVAIDGTVVIGEGEMDEAPMLYIGEKVGAGGPADGHRGRSAGRHHAHRQGRPERAGRDRAGRARQLPARARHLHGQDRGRRRAAGRRGRSRRRRSRRICATSRGPRSATSPTWSPASSTATAHEELIAKMREAGARIMLISDGDVAGVIATTRPG